MKWYSKVYGRAQTKIEPHNCVYEYDVFTLKKQWMISSLYIFEYLINNNV